VAMYCTFYMPCSSNFGWEAIQCQSLFYYANRL